MSDSDLKVLVAEFERQIREYDTPEKAREFLQSEGLLDEAGNLPPGYREEFERVPCQ